MVVKFLAFLILLISLIFLLLTLDSLFFQFLVPGKKRHFLREGLNTNLPQSISEAADRGYKRSASLFHQIKRKKVLKYVSPDGHKEVVFDQYGFVVTDQDRGTYNYAPYRKTLKSLINHFLADVFPWLIYGTSKQ